MKMEKVLIIGGGFAGINVAKKLMNTEYEVILLDKNNHHVFQPLLYQVASAALSPGDIAVPIREIVSQGKNINVYMEEVVGIDKTEKTVKCDSGRSYLYDYLIIATGSTPYYFGKEDWEKNAPGLKSLEDALNIRNRVLKSFENCELNNEQRLNFIIIGAGPTGVELAGAFAEIAYETLTNDFRNFNPNIAKIYLIEGGPEVLPSYSGKLSKKAKKYLEQLGVEVLTDNFVKEINDDYILLNDKKIYSDNIIWAAGNRASKLCEKLDVELDKMGRVIVKEDLSILDYPEIFVLGDAAHFKNHKNEILPGLAPVATQQGKHIAKQLLKRKRMRFNYLDKGSMATIGKYKAIMQWKHFKSAGIFAWLSWCFIHVLFLINFRNKLMVFMQWSWSFFFNKRGVRLITRD
jgi:NADH dehydrogenase